MASDIGISLNGSAAETGVSLKTFRELVGSFGFTMKPQDEQDYFTLLQELQTDLEDIEQLPEYIDPRLVPSGDPNKGRDYTVPPKAENPLNAWSHKFELKNDAAIPAGILAGRSVAVKDTVSLAGIPFTCGTQPYHLSKDAPYPLPTIDAPVVRRILDAGGVIKGTTTCENYCMSGLSFTSATGPVDNPWAKGYSAGGSSSGSAALVAIKLVKAWRKKRGLPAEDLGEGVDLALGGDQGGSIRLPAAFSGAYGLKPTHGLVPYTGIAALHPMVDHVGPMAASIRDLAVLLTAIAGSDGIDPRQSPEVPQVSDVPAYHALLDARIADKRARGEWTPSSAAKGLRIGVLKESLELPDVDAEVASVVRAAAARFASLGAASVTEVSIPLHARAMAVWSGAIRTVMADVFVANRAPDLLSHPLPNLDPPPPSQAWYDTMTASNPAVVTALLCSAHFSARGIPARVRNKALMHVAQLRAAYDAALADVDVLLLPVTPTVAPAHLPESASVLTKYRAVLGQSGNTAPFNITGHPALAVPAGWGVGKAEVAAAEGGGAAPPRRPVGLQIVGRRWDEVGVLFAGSALEVAGFGLDLEG